MRWRTTAFVTASVMLAMLFARLGVWQLDRLRERREHNEFLRRRMHAAPVALASLAGTPGELRYRRVRVEGRADYANEFVYASRTRDGSPGVYLMTPVLTGDTAVLVARGWVYAADGATVDRARWREGDSLTVVGYVEEMPATSQTPDTTPGRPGTVTRLDRARMETRIGRPLRAVYVLATGDSATRRGDVPARFALPELNDGPHKSYAFQWFSFAAIAVVGAGIVIRNDRGARAAR